MNRHGVPLGTLVALVAIAGASAAGQGRGGREGGTPKPAQATAPFDLTGYWVSIVNEDWLYRMVTPRKGDYARLPLNAEGRKAADEWDWSKDQAAGAQCRAYGAANIMRMPGRLRITWENDNTLRIDIDAGTQTRLLHFDKMPAPSGERSWQGYSVASWDKIAQSRGSFGDAPPPLVGGSLKVVTTVMRPGYLRKNGVPYGEQAVMTEFFDRHEDFGREWLSLTAIIEDPEYLAQPYVIPVHFQREADGSKWNPTPCEIVPPLK